MATRTQVLSVRLSPEILAELRDRALEDSRALSNYVAKVLTDHINQKGGEA